MTSAGENLVPLAQQWQDLASRVAGLSSGIETVHLTMPDSVATYLMPKVLRTLVETTPTWRHELTIGNVLRRSRAWASEISASQ